MIKLTPAEMDKKDALKVSRSAIRLRHSINADHEINDVIPDLENKIDQAMTGGPRLQISVGRLFEAAYNGDADDNV